MLAVRPFSLIASVALTAALLGILILSLASRAGPSGHTRDAALHAFDVAAPSRASDRRVARREAARARQVVRRPAPRDAKIALAPSRTPGNVQLLLPFSSATISAPGAATPGTATIMHAAAMPAPSDAQPVEGSARAASPPREEARPYSAIVVAWLKRHQHFPQSQVRDTLDATVLIAFTIDRLGRADHVRVVRGSGIAWLDALALRQVRSASPFPRPLQSDRAEALSFEVPMRYRARG